MLRNLSEFLVTNTVMATFFPVWLNHSGCMYALENLANQAQAYHHPETIFVTSSMKCVTDRGHGDPPFVKFCQNCKFWGAMTVQHLCISRYDDGQSKSLQLLSSRYVPLSCSFRDYCCPWSISMPFHGYIRKHIFMCRNSLKYWGGESSKKTRLLLFRRRVWRIIKRIFIYLNSFVLKAVKSVISQLCNINRNGISWLCYCVSIFRKVQTLIENKHYAAEHIFFALEISLIG